MKRLLLSGREAIILLMVAISFLVTDRLRYVMIVSIPDTITHQELERKLFLKKTYGEVLNLKLKAIIARERLRFSVPTGCGVVLPATQRTSGEIWLRGLS